MDTRKSPKEIATTLLHRSCCMVKVAAVIEDGYGLHGWGWNSSGPDGYGMCAEMHAIIRSNKKRLEGSTIYVAGQWRDSDKVVPSKPCKRCSILIAKWKMNVWWRDKGGVWRYGL